ncbi:LytR C-terminal domain-containing protein [Leucobacter weissii]|uniref:LytR C-terminal domain-containing protein n=1 Tax=Leucobacter weissii TaxID=1983706 RepID=A0A939SAQ5_9MICO|nr:LytR C-terminal domain-containing protein [Leucobacter weissii]MBO1900643.1 LytR C-terminal domain-containing protein [Leucobacter weissii]
MARKHGDDATARARAEATEDRFDRVPRSGRAGAHRLVARRRRFWWYAVAVVLGVVLLGGAGIFALHSFGSGATGMLEGGNGSGSGVQRTEPELDPEASVAILNGTKVSDLENAVGRQITDNEWGEIAFAGIAASDDVEISAVFYSAAEDEAAALGLSAELGGMSPVRSSDYDEYGVRLVVLLGADYAGPGRDEVDEGEAAPADAQG